MYRTTNQFYLSDAAGSCECKTQTRAEKARFLTTITITAIQSVNWKKKLVKNGRVTCQQKGGLGGSSFITKQIILLEEEVSNNNNRAKKTVIKQARETEIERERNHNTSQGWHLDF